MVTLTKQTVDVDFRQTVVATTFDMDETVYIYDSAIRTKSEIEDEISYCDAIIQELIGQGETDLVTIYEDQLSLLKEELEDAPNTPVVATDYSADAYMGTIGKYKYTLTFMPEATEANYIWWSFSIKTDKLLLKPYKGAANVSFSMYDYQDTSANETDMTIDEAETIAKDFLAEYGIEEVILTDSDDLVWQYADATGNIIASAVDGYYLTFANSINGVAIYNGFLGDVDNIAGAGNVIDSAESYYYISVWDGMVVWAQVLQAGGAMDTWEEVASLLTFDEIMADLDANVGAYYKSYQTNYKSITFDDVRFTYFLVAENDGTKKYISVWLFIECDETMESDEENAKEGYGAMYPRQAIVVDAQTGEIVDIVENAKLLGTYYE